MGNLLQGQGRFEEIASRFNIGFLDSLPASLLYSFLVSFFLALFVSLSAGLFKSAGFKAQKFEVVFVDTAFTIS